MEKNLCLLVAIASTGLCFAPIPDGSKLLASGAGIATSVLGVVTVRSEKNRKAADKAKKEIQEKENRDRLQLRLSDLELQLKERETAIALKEEELIQQLYQLDRDKAESTALLSSQERIIEQELAVREQQTNKRIKQARKRCADAIKKARFRMRRRMWSVTKEIDEIRAIAIAEGEKSKADAAKEIEEAWAEADEAMNADKAEVRKEIEQAWEDARRAIALERKKFSKEVQETQDALVEAEQQLIDDALRQLNQLKDELKKGADAALEERLVPFYAEMNQLMQERDGLKSTVAMLREQLAENRDIKLCDKHGTVHGDRANAVLLFLKEKGVYCDYDSSVVEPEGKFILNFHPWEVGVKAEKSIKGLLAAMQVRFGLGELPIFAPNGEARAWTFIFQPATKRAIALNDFYTPVLPEMRVSEHFETLEPELREAIASKLSYQQQVEEMLNFVPPVPLPRPTSYQLSEMEVACVRWFHSWRQNATGEENITTVEALLYYVYGVRVRSDRYDAVIGEKLADRVKRILSVLNVQFAELDGEYRG